MIRFICEDCGEQYTCLNAISSSDGSGKISISTKPCHYCMIGKSNEAAESSRLKEQKRLGSIIKVICFGNYDDCINRDFDACPFTEACREYKDGNLPDDK